jgi:hypothetical protein
MNKNEMDMEELVEKIQALNRELIVMGENVIELEESIEMADFTWIYDADNNLNQIRKSIGEAGSIIGELLTKLDPQDWWRYC